MVAARGSPSDGPTPLTARLRADLSVAMKDRDRVAVAALRTALAAIANAEAIPVDELPTPSSVPTPGKAQELPRRVLTAVDMEALLQHELADRRDTIAQLRGRGQDEAIERLSAEIAVLQRYLD